MKTKTKTKTKMDMALVIVQALWNLPEEINEENYPVRYEDAVKRARVNNRWELEDAYDIAIKIIRGKE